MNAPPRGDSDSERSARLQAARREFEIAVQRFEETRERLRATIESYQESHPQRELLRTSEFARLQAQAESMPVIEQAKGILMAQQHCGPEEAFDLLRRASQRSNVRVSVLAAQIVSHVSASHANGSVYAPLCQARPGLPLTA